jgi:hypothetical protein
LTVGVIVHLGWLGWVSAISTFMLVAFTFWLFALCGLDDLRSCRRQLTEWSLLASAAAVAFIGLGGLVGAWTVVIALVMAASHPWVVSQTRGRSRADAAGSCRETPAAPDSTLATSAHPAAKSVGFGRPSRLSDDGLRRCWEASWTLLQNAKTLQEAERIIRYRKACLDEIARRNPESFQLWIQAGAPSADEPARRLPTTFDAAASS